MDSILKIKTIKIILNKSNGIFNYSPDFYRKYKQLYQEDFDYSKHTEFKFRTDPKIIKIFELFGKYKSSSIISDLYISYIPEELLNYHQIINKNGYEKIIINYNKAYVDILFGIIKTDNISELYKNQIKKIKYIKYIEKNFNIKNSELFDFIN